MVQELIILLVFIAAALYMGRMLYRSFAAKSGCAKSCGACSTIDFKKIQKDLEKSVNRQ
ncbi:FeoB-associated Cys-rich membrane protein [Pontibacter cellulosilyticus]|uniref:FeoB-associated Cys-rich membrane protein n=1 Tax=Pontibacter cellulosilyticus TaxID=1720253 RepID=A0A923NAY8_9BACT|nr:FeoB-associated Cys-rich membrane protein [Pontibacter cellulosilyticus]MBC5994097.1 FeoB-associated Cys-rich membrane protein [Pontibacter cellulosilyticus]